MTEDEAKTKWCPFIQISIEGLGSRITNNRGKVIKEDGKNNLRCIGSQCMAWRWHTRSSEHYRYDNEGEKIFAWTTDDHGYCGLAGKP